MGVGNFAGRLWNIAFVQNCHIHFDFIIHVRQLENIFGRKEKTDG